MDTFIPSSQFVDGQVIKLLHRPEYLLEPNCMLVLDVTEVGTINWRNVLAAIDYQVRGN